MGFLTAGRSSTSWRVLDAPNTAVPAIRYTLTKGQKRLRGFPGLFGIGAPAAGKPRHEDREVQPLRSKKAKNENLKRVDTAAAADGPLGLSLGELMGRPAPSPEPAKKPEPLPFPATPPPAFSRIVLQRTRAGRGGKWVIRVLLAPPPAAAQLEALSREVRKALGTGAHTEEGVLVVQGDIADRLEEWFRKRGAPKVVR